MIEFVNQISVLSRFTGVDEDTGEQLPVQVWSDKVWATEFAEGLALEGLNLSWSDCTVYHQGSNHTIAAGSHAFEADAQYAMGVTVWLDPSSPDGLTIDEVLLDGCHDAPAAPAVGEDYLRLAWGEIPAEGVDFVLNVLRHRQEV